MHLLTYITDYETTIKMAPVQLEERVQQKEVLFHSYWNGPLNEKHLYSIQSCYYFNCFPKKEEERKEEKTRNKIILWLENDTSANPVYKKIEQYAEIRLFCLPDQLKESVFLENRHFRYNPAISFYSDLVRYLLLYNYGGCWFDLDCLFLRSFDPLFRRFGQEICVYQWENQAYPNGAIYISLEARSDKLKRAIELIVRRGQGWGFQEAKLTYNTDMDLLVLPCSWFDGGWIPNPYKISFQHLFLPTHQRYDFTTFFPGAFCFHWHNKWNQPIHATSIMQQLMTAIQAGISEV